MIEIEAVDKWKESVTEKKEWTENVTGKKKWT